MKLDRIIAVRNDRTVFRDGELCMKVFGSGCDKTGIFREAFNQTCAAGTGLRVPETREVTAVDGRWTIVSDFIKGKTLAQLMAEDPDKSCEYMKLFVDLQLEVHGKSCPLLGRAKDELNRKICLTDSEATVRYDLHDRLESMPRQNRLCHGDFEPSNIIVAEDGNYILDWEDAAQGDPCADAAATYLSLLRNGYDCEQYLDLYCCAGTDRRDIEKWIPIAAAAKSVECPAYARDFYKKFFTGI